MQDGEGKEVDHNVVVQNQRPLGDYELMVNEATNGFNDGPESGIDNSVHHKQKQLSLPPPSPPGPSIGWERFLPVKSLKVLLVENDDSTRHVVNALLRNCNYEGLADHFSSSSL